ncbi:hypothetical protein P7C73_g226, partial [Tremellales sp. Uapishka_1]
MEIHYDHPPPLPGKSLLAHIRPAPPVPRKKKRAPSLEADPSGVDLSKIRAHAACKSCRTKKVKCLPGPAVLDGQQPPGPCQQCLQCKIECTYPPTRDRAAYSRQYVQNLEARVQALENLSNYRIMPMLKVFESGGTRMKTHPPDGTGEPVELGGEGDEEEEEDEEEEGAGEDTERQGGVSGSEEGDDGQMAQDEHGNYRWIGSSNTLTLLDSFGQSHPADNHHLPPTSASGPHTTQTSPSSHSGPTPRNNPYFGPVAGSGVVKALPNIDEVNYPPRRYAEEMVNAFFEEVFPCLPIVLEHDFREGFTALMERRENGLPETSDEGFVSVCFAVFALGERVIVTSRAWQRERAKQPPYLPTRDSVAPGVPTKDTVLPGEAEAGVIWYERAQILHYTALKDVNLYQVQRLTLLAAFQASVNAMPMSWLLAGQAMRVAQDLGLHRSSARMRLPFAEKQLRSRCWWAIYGLERMVSISLGRPVGVDDLDIDVAYPADIDDEGLRRIAKEGLDPNKVEAAEEPLQSTMSGFIALTRLCKIAGRVAHVLYRPSNGRSVSDPTWAVSQQNTINRLDKLLRDWLANDVPVKYKDPSSYRSVQLVSAVLSNSYFAVLITLHRNFLPPNPDFPRPKPPPSSQSLAHCVDAARSVIHIAAQSRVLLPPSHHLAVFCQYLWSSAVILLLCEVQAKDQVVIDAVGSHVESCRRSLHALEPVWPGSQKLKELLNDVESRTKDVLARPTKPSKKRKSSGLETPGSSRLSTMLPPHQHGPPPQYRSHTSSSSRTVSPGQGQPSWQPPPPQVSTPYNPSAFDHPSQLPKRTKLEQPRYETSNTRTPVSLETDYASFPMDFTPMESQPTFDVGGVTFDGLEMLQGFTGVEAAANFWNTLATSSTGSEGFQTQPFTSQQGTPNSGPASAGASGSPSSWQYQPGPNPLDMEEFWNQVAGSSFDWQADPSVPFNIGLE